MKAIRPKLRRSFTAMGGRRLVIEGFGRRAPTFVAIVGGDSPQSAWLTPTQLRRLIEAGKKILR